MTREEIFQTLKEILQNDEYTVLKDLIPSMTEDTSLIDDFTFDSLQFLNIITKIEQKFGIVCELDKVDLDRFDKISRLIDLVQSKQAA